MAVAAEFHVEATSIADLFQRLKDRREVDRPFPEPQVIVNAAHHVFDVDREQPVAPLDQVLRDRSRFETMDVTDVHAQSQLRTIDSREQLAKVLESGDKHPRLRLEGESHVHFVGPVENPPHTLSQPIKGHVA